MPAGATGPSGPAAARSVPAWALGSVLAAAPARFAAGQIDQLVEEMHATLQVLGLVFASKLLPLLGDAGVVLGLRWLATEHLEDALVDAVDAVGIAFDPRLGQRDLDPAERVDVAGVVASRSAILGRVAIDPQGLGHVEGVAESGVRRGRQEEVGRQHGEDQGGSHGTSSGPERGESGTGTGVFGPLPGGRARGVPAPPPLEAEPLHRPDSCRRGPSIAWPKRAPLAAWGSGSAIFWGAQTHFPVRRRTLASSRSYRHEVRSADGFFQPLEAAPTERAILVGVHILASRPGDEPIFADLDELARLTDTAGAEVVASVEQRRTRPDVRTLLGKGKVQQLKQMIGTLQANLVVFDNDLSPAQGRNLEKTLGVNIIDRTELILDIFARHARTQQSRLQVELAQYEYLLPRLTRMWSHLERQAGGIGTRGPGETQIESDRRLIRRRITHLRRELKTIDRRMVTQHKRRQDSFRVALVGYTNAGKSSLMNRLTEAGVYVRDQLFATLDATTRRVETPDRHEFLLTDTVGFIRKLPHHLVESFRATLSEVDEADLLFHVIDVGAEDLELQMESVDEVLRAVTSNGVDQVLVFNKTDTVPESAVENLRARHPEAVFTSAVDGSGMEGLMAAVDERLRRDERRLTVRIANEHPRSVAQVHALADVSEVEYDDEAAEVSLRVSGRNYGRIVGLPGLRILEIAGRGAVS